jgi:F-type H+-transporting ATPase subunit g
MSSATSTANSAANSAASTAKSATPENVLSSIRNINREQMITYGVIGAEVLGFFTVGTMVGRLKIVGYHGQPHHEH